MTTEIARPLTVQFLQRFPIGTTLQPAAFDTWAEQQGLMPSLPPDISKQSDAWKARLQRRHEIRYKLNRLASKRVDGQAGGYFTIDAAGHDVWEVRSSATAVARNVMASRVASLTVTKRRQLARLMESADWSILPPYEKVVAETLYNDIEYFEQNVVQHSTHLATKFDALGAKLQRAMDAGTLVPQNGGIKGVIAAAAGDIVDAEETRYAEEGD